VKRRQDTTAPAKLAKTNLVLEYDEVVIGSDLTAVLYAFNHNLPIFFTRTQRPFRFDYFEPSIDFSYIGEDCVATTLSLHEGSITVGLAKNLMWERLLFILSLAGNTPLSNLCGHIRYDGETMVCSNEYSKIADIKFEQAYYFGDDNCVGFVEKEVANDSFICYDWIAFNRGGKHEIDLIETPDDFVKQIWFYPTDRIDGNSPVKDACLISRLTDEQLLDFNYSQTMARFKMVYEMESRGMKGVFNGHCPKYGHPKYYKFKTTSLRRESRAQSQSARPSTSKVKIATESEALLIKDLPKSSRDYQKIIEHICI